MRQKVTVGDRLKFILGAPDMSENLSWSGARRGLGRSCTPSDPSPHW